MTFDPEAPFSVGYFTLLHAPGIPMRFVVMFNIRFVVNIYYCVLLSCSSSKIFIRSTFFWCLCKKEFPYPASYADSKQKMGFQQNRAIIHRSLRRVCVFVTKFSVFTKTMFRNIFLFLALHIYTCWLGKELLALGVLGTKQKSFCIKRRFNFKQVRMFS